MLFRVLCRFFRLEATFLLEFLVLGLRRCGLQAIPLTTPEIIELFWSHFHPREAEFGYYPEIPPELAF